MAQPSQMIKRFLPKSLFGRSLMIIITPLILLQVVSTWIFFDRHWDTITRRLASSIAGDIAWILEGMRPDMSEKARAELFARARRHKGGTPKPPFLDLVENRLNIAAFPPLVFL